jgi:hypothetical protein
MFYPKDTFLPALEKNILKYRAFEIALILFYSENLKKLIIKAVQSTNKFRRFIGKKPSKEIATKTIKSSKEALKRLVNENILTKVECEEIEQLIHYRNIIAHEIHLLTADIGSSFSSVYNTYNHNVRERLEFYHTAIPQRLQKSYIITISLATVIFKGAEKTYKEEIRRLKMKIIKQLKVRQKTNSIINKEYSFYNKLAKHKDYTDHPNNKYRNGRLTQNGIDWCYRLFEKGNSPYIVAQLMRISYKSSLKHFRIWKETKIKNK